MSESPQTAADHQAAVESEYGTYVAVETIFIGGARAFNVGDPVPVSHVSENKVPEGSVAKITTKAGREAAGITEKG